MLLKKDFLRGCRATLIQGREQMRKLDSKNHPAWIRSFQILILQIFFGYFFNSIGQKRRPEQHSLYVCFGPLSGSPKLRSSLPRCAKRRPEQVQQNPLLDRRVRAAQQQLEDWPVKDPRIGIYGT